MAIFRIHKTDNFTTMSNHHLRNMNLSLKAKGLLSVMLSLPDDWDYSEKGLSQICKDGIASIRSALKELEQYGYVVRNQSKNDKGRFLGYEYDIYENPKLEKPFSENPITDNPISENRTQLNTNTTNSLNNQLLKDIKDIVEYLNEKTGSHFRWQSKDTQRHINARIKEGYTLDDFKKVVDIKCSHWLNDSKMSDY